MKKIIFLFCMVVMIPFGLNGQTVRDFSLTFDKDSFIFHNQDGLTHINTSKYISTFLSDTLSPALPYIGINILIRPNESYEDFEFTDSEIKIMDDVIMASNEMPVPTSIPIPQKKNGIVRYANDTYPMQTVQYSGTHILDGYKFISFIVCPFKYDVSEKKLYIKNKLNLRISLSQTSEPAYNNGNMQNNVEGRHSRESVKKLVINSQDINNLYGNAPAPIKISRQYGSVPVEYLIVTNERLKPVFKRLAEWKTRKGIMADILTVEEIDKKYQGNTQQLRIKKALYDYKQQGMEYALLGGDVDVVPSLICDLPHKYINNQDTTKTSCTDLYYSCFDKNFEWNEDGDDIYGEINYDNIDLAQDITVTRVPVSKKVDADIFVNRTLEYESNPNTKEWENKILMCANEDIDKGGVHGAIVTRERTYNDFIQPFWKNNRFILFCNETSHPLGADYDFISENLSSELSKGYTFVDINSHGDILWFGFLEKRGKYLNTDAMSFVNKGYTIMIPRCCKSNAFDYDGVCMSEAFIRNPNSGIIAFFGCTSFGWQFTGDKYYNSFYKSLFTNKNKTFGQAARDSRNSYLSILYPNGIDLNMVLVLNPIGDPEMPIFTSKPKKIEDANVNFKDGVLSISCGAQHYKVCVSSAFDNGETFYEVENTFGNISFNNVPRDCYVCITREGYIPYVCRIGDPVFIQNENFYSDVEIISRNTYIGSNIINRKIEGPVVVEKGKITIKNSGNVFIKNDFEVKKGAEFEINKDK